jgi:integrase/recombinase XerD
MRTYPLPIYLQRFFTERLAAQFHASSNTIASYRDTFRLLLRYAADRLGRQPTQLQVLDLDANLVGDFLTFLETNRGNGSRSRNTRLSAIHSFFKYVAGNEPQLLHHCQQVLAMPSKRHEKRTIDFLTGLEIEALIEAADKTTPCGRRDRMLLMLALQTGLRVSELISLNCSDVALGSGAHVRCMGKGRKERATPLRKDCVEALPRWLSERLGADSEPLFISNRGDRLSRDAVERIVRKHVALAALTCPTLRGKRVTPHVLRHSAAMQLLQDGVDRTVIALWLGHESVETTQMYVHADIELKEKAIAKTQPVASSLGRYRPGDELLAFLEGL